MEKIKKYFINKIVVWTFIFILICLFYFIPTNNNFDIEIANDTKEYTSNVVYLLDNDNYVSKVVTYFDSENIIDEIKSKINVLINGDSSLKSFYSLIPKGTILKNVKVDKDTVYLDFNKELLNVNEYIEESMIEAIVWTVTEINGINNVYISVDSETLKELPNSHQELPVPLTRNYGINKKYDIKNFNDLDKTIIYFSKSDGENNYYVPVTKISNMNSEKIDIIIEELKSSINAQDNLNGFIPNNLELVSSEIDNNKMNLVFNNYIFNDSSKKVILEEVKYLLSESVFANYDIDEVIFSTESDKNITRVVKK